MKLNKSIAADFPIFVEMFIAEIVIFTSIISQSENHCRMKMKYNHRGDKLLISIIFSVIHGGKSYK